MSALAVALCCASGPVLAQEAGVRSHEPRVVRVRPVPVAWDGAEAVAEALRSSGDKAPRTFFRSADAPTTFSRLYEMARAGRIKVVRVVGDHTVEAVTDDGRTSTLNVPPSSGWVVDLAKAGVDVDYSQVDRRSPMQVAVGIVFASVPVLLIMLYCLAAAYLWRTIRSKSNPGEFVAKGKIATRFEDVVGADEAKEALVEVVAYLRNPFQYGRLGGRIRRGVLLVGDPGNGKTLLARAVAGEANVAFYSTTGAAFQEMFAGLGASRVRKMFKVIRKKKGPAIVFIDEFDSLGRRRSDQSSAVQDDAAATLNQLLTEMDGIVQSSGIVVIAATNRPDVLDPAVLRPGRFDRQIIVPPPDLKARRGILGGACKGVTLGSDVDLDVMARGTPGFSGADIAGLVNEAVLRASRSDGAEVTMADFEWARDSKLLGGAERVGMTLADDEGQVVAYHESGHALVSVLKPECDPIHKGTIVPRGRALGFISSMPVGDRVLMRKSKMKAEIVMLMGGRAAEEVRFGSDTVTSGASADIVEATRIARLMVTKLGFGSTMASRDGSSGPLGTSTLSERTMEAVDREVEEIVSVAYAEAVTIVSGNREALEALVAEFARTDTLTGAEIVAVVERTKALDASVVAA